jgi:CheY-like chemotaxis protein
MTKILIVEDESSFSEALSFLLGKEGYDVAVAATGTDAIKQFNEEHLLKFQSLCLPQKILKSIKLWA